MEDLTMKKAVIYARQSYGKEESALSTEQQILQCRKWCEKNNIQIVGEYSENNTSSELYDDSEEGHAYAMTDREWQKWSKEQLTKGRKKFKKKLALAFEHLPEVDYFIVNERTRFYRNPSPLSGLSMYFLSKLKTNGVALVEAETAKIDYINNDVEIAVHALLATYEMQKLKEKRLQSIKVVQKLKNDGITFSNCYASIWDSKNQVLSFDTEKVEVVKYVFESVIAYKTYTEILTTINKKFKHLANGKCFYTSSIYNIIKNIQYCGMRFNADGSIIKSVNVINPPIDFLTWKKANEIVAKKKNCSGKQNYNVRGERKNFLPLSGLMKCGNCGSRIVMVQDRGISYFCKNTIIQKDKNCTSSRIRIETTNNDLLLSLQALFSIKMLHIKRELEKRKNFKAEISAIECENDQIKKNVMFLIEKQETNKMLADVFEEKIMLSNKKLEENAKKLHELQSINSKINEIEDERNRKEMELIKETETRLDDDVYSRYVRETIQGIIVYDDKIKIKLFDDNVIELPRILLKYRVKEVPFSSSYFKIENGCMKAVVNFYCSNTESTKFKTLINIENEYEINLFE